VLFAAWWSEYTGRLSGRSPFAGAWSERAPRTTPDGLADPDAAVLALAAATDSVTQRHGSPAVAWGVVHRVRRDGLDHPANGAASDLGVFNVVTYAPEGDGTLAVRGGASYVCAVEFADPPRAVSLLGYGNTSRAGSPHRTDQLVLYAGKRWKPVLRTRAEIERSLESREHVPGL